MILQLISAFFTSLFFSIMFHVSKRNILFSGLIGTLGWTIYLLTLKMNDSFVTATFLGTVCVTLVAYLLATFRKAPVTVFLIPGIIPLVPGALLYQTAYHYTQKAYTVAQQYLFDTVSAAAAIAIAVVIVSALYRAIRQITD